MFPTPHKDDAVADGFAMVAAGKQRAVLGEINNSGAGAGGPRGRCCAQTQYYQFRNVFVAAPPSRASPLPDLSWADSDELWRSMASKDSCGGVYERNNAYLCRHDDLQPRMRSILLDWIMEVCEVYTLHRETFYLAVDYIDRYLSNTKNIHKTRLQLVGVTALFIASKLEEIYPPKLADFAYVTDGACTEDEILQQELLMLSTLKWSLSPVTAVAWLNVYLQTAHATFSPHVHQARNGHRAAGAVVAFFMPQYPQETFVNITQLLDLCLLDIDSLQFASGVLAAAALYHFSSRDLATQVSGYDFDDIAPCAHWMEPFAITIREVGLNPMKQFKRVLPTDTHCIQTHSTNIDVLDQALDNRSRVAAQQVTCQSPTEVGAPFMTPPKSGQKQPAPPLDSSGEDVVVVAEFR